MTKSSPRTKVFISYSHKDKEWLERVQVHIEPLVREGLEVWDDTQITAGSRWEKEIRNALDSAKVAVLLVSADFLYSDYIADTELPAMLTAAEKDDAVILSLIISPSRFKKTPLAQFQTVNDPAKPLIKLPKGDQEAILVRLTEEIEKNFEASVASQENGAVPGVSPKPPDSKPTRHPLSIELAKLVRREISRLFKKKKLYPLGESLLQWAKECRPDENQPEDPAYLLVPLREMFSIEDSMDDLHQATRNCLENLMDQGSSSISNVANDATEVLGWLALLAVSETWVQEEAGLQERLLSANYIAIPVETEAGIEVVFSRLRSDQKRCYPAKLELDNDGDKVVGSRQLPWPNDLELGIEQSDRLTDIKKLIWKMVMKSDISVFGQREEKRLRETLAVRYRRGESHYLIIPNPRDGSSAIDNAILARLRHEFPHLVPFLIGSESGDQVFVMDEFDLQAKVREFLLMLRDYL